MNGGEKTRRVLRTGLALLVLCGVQTLIFPQARLWGVCPQVFPLAALVAGMREGPEFGGWFGMAAGALAALITSGVSVLWVPVCTVLGMGAGFLALGGIRQNVLGSFFGAAMGLTLLELGQMSLRRLAGEGPFASLARIAGPELLWSLVWFPLVYGLFALALRRKRAPA